MKKILLIVNVLTVLIFLENDIAAQAIVPYPYYDMTSWDSSPYKSYSMSGSMVYPWYDMTFRLLWPKNYDSSLVTTSKYPLIIMLHGAGESGISAPGFHNYDPSDPRFMNNDHQLLHGGDQHLKAVNNGQWKGFVLFPQNPFGFWGKVTWLLDQVVEMVNTLSQTLKIDPNRIHIHGLSSGASGTWDAILRYPNFFASALPMSGIDPPTENNTLKVTHMPIWYFQGGIDNNPSKDVADQTINSIRAAGGTPKYTVYPDLHHTIWNNAYSDPDFFPFMERHSKLSIQVAFGKTEFCAGSSISAKLSLSPGFTDYEWRKDSVTITGAIQHQIVVTQIGKYTARFKRNGIWTTWSQPIELKIKPPTNTPSIIALESTALPSLSGSTTVTLSAPSGYSAYKWSTNDTTRSIIVASAGTYTVQVTEAEGCISLASEPVVVTTSNSSDIPEAPAHLTISGISATGMDLSWSDESLNEAGFEIYRSYSKDDPYTFVKLLNKNVSTFADSHLIPATTYYYRVRAINNNGSSTYAQAEFASTAPDIIAPSIPESLSVVGSTTNLISLAWRKSVDNAGGIITYLIYKNALYEGMTKDTIYISDSLNENQVYSFTVKAKDSYGNISEESNQVTSAAINKGLKYSYYEGEWNVLPNFASILPVKSGWVNNFNLTPRNSQDHFAFKFDGKIYLPTSGQYTFYTSSDDGSKLYIDSAQIVNNDSLHADLEKSGVVNLSAGLHAITTTFFEKGGGEALKVSYSGPGINKQLVPDNSLVSAYVPLMGPNAPSNLTTSAVDYNKVNLSWQDNSNNETKFEIYRATSSANWSFIASVSQQSTTYSDASLVEGTQYFYKVKAVNNNGVSSFSSERSITTPRSPFPLSPSLITATPVSSSEIYVTWKDNSTNEGSFEIYRAAEFNGAYSLIHNTLPNVTSYNDTNLSAYKRYFYKIRAANGDFLSAFTPIISSQTRTNSPVLKDVGDKTFPEGSSYDIALNATDSDNDTVTFSAQGLPSFASLVNDGSNSAKLILTPDYIHEGTYPNVIITASDRRGGVDSEIISITILNVNRKPVIADIEDQIVNEGATLSIDLFTKDPDGDMVTLSASNLPPGFTTVSYEGNGVGTMILSPGYTHGGIYDSIIVASTDGKGGSAKISFKVTVVDIKMSPESYGFPKGKNLKIQPNPIFDVIRIVFDTPKNELIQVELQDDVGKKLIAKDYNLSNETSIVLDLASISLRERGFYILKVNSKSITNQIVKLIKE